MKPRTIAIDGTAASGKSTLGWAIAQHFQYLYLDTGMMYRAVTWHTLNTQTDVNDEAQVSHLAETMDLQIISPTIADGRQATVTVNGQDVTWLIRHPDVDANVSRVSAYPQVRQRLTERQREIAAAGPVVMVGRDIGTVVLPHADLKIFTEASVAVRATRRYTERLQRGEAVNYEHILAAMTRRDKMDRERAISPMVPAEDALIIQTDSLTREDVFEQVEALIKVATAA
jgi:cytidylate kinase